jgi:aminoglycoside phosphotransferase (APT) family kinase protein
VRVASSATSWGKAASLAPAERAGLAGLIDRLPALFAGRSAVLAHGDFAPVNVLTDGPTLTGLLDFESVRLADPLFDPAWWAWSVSFGSASVLEAAWPEFLGGAGIDAADPELPARIHSLQVLRMLELLAGDSLDSGVRDIVAERLARTLQS